MAFKFGGYVNFYIWWNLIWLNSKYRSSTTCAKLPGDGANFHREFCERPTRIYKEIWAPAIGEDLMCEREPSNSVDPYAVAVIRRLEFSGSGPAASSSSSAGSSGTTVSWHSI